jgi:hypothetical protein
MTTPTLHGVIHIIGAFVLVWSIILGFLAIAWRFAHGLRWWGWAVYSALSALCTLACIALFGMAQQHGGDAGLFERLAVSAEPVWEILLLARLWSGAKRTRLL